MTNKSLLTLLTIAVLGLFLTPLVQVNAVTVPPTSGSVDFAKLQQQIIKVIDASVARLNNMEAKISSSQYMSATTKQIIIDGLNKTEQALLNYKSQVQSATSVAELQAINQQVVQYLKDNKDVIRASVKQAITAIANEALARADELEQKIDQAIKALKIACPQEIDAINELEAQLQELKVQGQELSAAIKSQDTAAIKKEINEVAVLSKAIVANLVEIEEACF